MGEYDDLKTWLRSFIPADEPWATMNFTPGNIREAADAIEALERERAAQHDDFVKKYEVGSAQVTKDHKRIEALEATNKQLREALEKAAQAAYDEIIEDCGHVMAKAAYHAVKTVARAALATQTRDSEPTRPEGEPTDEAR